MRESTSTIQPVSELLNGQTLIPVVAVDDAEQALGLAGALLDGGVSVIEVTLRSDFGIAAIELIKERYPEMLVLAGTVNTAALYSQVVAAGVDGIISPGISRTLLETARQYNIAYLPGVATSSEILLAIEYGLNECKLFPAEVVGGVSALKALAGPFPDIKFCPTGGVSSQNYQDYLALDNVMCVGGSWIAPSAMIRAHDWAGITQRCADVAP